MTSMGLPAATFLVGCGDLIRDADFAARVSGQWHALVTHGLFRGSSSP